jgi:flagellar basal body-associated protein FliL
MGTSNPLLNNAPKTFTMKDILITFLILLIVLLITFVAWIGFSRMSSNSLVKEIENTLIEYCQDHDCGELVNNTP